MKDVVIGGVLGVAFAGIGYGIGKAFGALKLKFSNSGGSGVRVFESKDPLVGEVATQIEREFPGSVNGVNRIVHRPDGSILTDLDIELENIVIQVKSGGGKGLTRQLINSANYIKKIVIGYAPEIKPSVLNEAQKNGFQVFTNIADLLEFIGKNLGGL